MTYEKPIKICLYGYTGVGCNQLSRVATGLKFDGDLPCVLNWSHVNKEFIINERKYIANIWNGPGQERFKSPSKLYLKNANIIILVYDITNRQTFYDLSYSIDIIKDLCDNYIGAIVGNKSDLYMNESVSEEEAREFAERIGFKFALVSAKNDKNGFIEFLERLVKDFLEANNDIIKLIEKERQQEIEEEKKE